MVFVNKTGRDLTIYSSPADTVGRTFPADGPAAKWAGFAPAPRCSLDGIPVQCQPAGAQDAQPGDITGLPDPEPGTVYIVAFPVEVAAVALGRTDVLRMGPARYTDGKQSGAEGFASSLSVFS